MVVGRMAKKKTATDVMVKEREEHWANFMKWSKIGTGICVVIIALVMVVITS
jgi:hypothetical protein